MKRETLVAVLCYYFCFINCTVITSNEPRCRNSTENSSTENNSSENNPIFYKTPIQNSKYYEPKWSNLESRPLPDWFDKAKIGVFIHWGVYSVPSFGSEWFWINWKGNPSSNPSAQRNILKYMTDNYKPGFTYQDFATQFTADLFDPAEWASIIEASGAKYVVFTSKHHDGYAMWPSNYSYSWNSVDVGPHKDISGQLAKAIRENTKLRFGFYYSLFEWFHPLYLADKAKNFTTQTFVNYKILPELRELVNTYQPEVIWTDGEWEAPSKYWKAEEFLSWLYNESPVRETVVVNDRWGQETLCKHGGYFTCADRFSPGKLLERKWENALTIDKGSWGYSRLSSINNYLTTQQLIDILVQTVAFGGNILINIGPTKSGTISPIYQERLIDVGKWLKVNGKAIYESSPWNICQNDTNHPSVWYTTKNDGKELYIIFLRWPKSGFLYLSCLKKTEDSNMAMLGLHNVEIKGTLTDNGILKIELPKKELIETDWGWLLCLNTMSKKRSATTELNSDNWDVDDEPEEAGTFKSVDPDVLKKRVIKVARRKFSKTNTEQSKLFSGFSGFAKPNTASTTPDVKNTFSFLSNLNGSSSQTTSPSVPSTMPSLLSSSSTSSQSKPADSKSPIENLHATKIKVLNECLLEWISKWVSKNPTCVLTPVFRDYEKHLESIKSGTDNQKEESKPTEKVPELKFNFTPVFGNNQKPTTDSKPSESKSDTFKMPESSPSSFKNSGGWLKTRIGSLGENSLNSKPAPVFGFSSGKPSFLQNIGASGSSESSAKQEDEGDDETPIVNDFKPVTEDNALYSQRVKVFVKNNESYSDRGVGNLFIKETKDNKGESIYQALVRADTALGNIIFNIRITKDIPTKRVGKNNVMVICVPTPDSKPPPVAVLLRVKTEEDADKLLAEINKYK